MSIKIKSFGIKSFLQKLGAGPPLAAAPLCRYDTIGFMRVLWALVFICYGCIGLEAQPPGAGALVAVVADHPRLFLRPARLRLVRRERDRSSVRWQQLDAFVTGGAPLAEPGFTQALY